MPRWRLHEAVAVASSIGAPRHVVLHFKTIWQDPLLRVQFMEHITDVLDRAAGKRALPVLERYIQRRCRETFGIYDPGMAGVAGFIDKILRDVSESEAELYLKGFTGDYEVFGLGAQ